MLTSDNNIMINKFDIADLKMIFSTDLPSYVNVIKRVYNFDFYIIKDFHLKTVLLNHHQISLDDNDLGKWKKYYNNFYNFFNQSSQQIAIGYMKAIVNLNKILIKNCNSQYLGFSDLPCAFRSNGYVIEKRLVANIFNQEGEQQEYNTIYATSGFVVIKLLLLTNLLLQSERINLFARWTHMAIIEGKALNVSQTNVTLSIIQDSLQSAYKDSQHNLIKYIVEDILSLSRVPKSILTCPINFRFAGDIINDNFSSTTRKIFSNIVTEYNHLHLHTQALYFYLYGLQQTLDISIATSIIRLIVDFYIATHIKGDKHNKIYHMSSCTCCWFKQDNTMKKAVKLTLKNSPSVRFIPTSNHGF